VSPYGDIPFEGNANIGIRLVCRNAGLAKPDMGELGNSGVAMRGIPKWSFKRGERFGKKKDAKTVSTPVMNMARLSGGIFVRHDKKTLRVASFEMSKYAATYDRWRTVKQWGEANGYDFDHNGDMGSMFFLNT